MYSMLWSDRDALTRQVPEKECDCSITGLNYVVVSLIMLDYD